MARRVTWTTPAWQDLEKAADYIATDSQHYAAALVREARDAARSLRLFANRGRIVPEVVKPEIRELFVGRYRLIYRVNPNTVEILAFIHGARDLRRLLPNT